MVLYASMAAITLGLCAKSPGRPSPWIMPAMVIEALASAPHFARLEEHRCNILSIDIWSCRARGAGALTRRCSARVSHNFAHGCGGVGLPLVSCVLLVSFVLGELLQLGLKDWIDVPAN